MTDWLSEQLSTRDKRLDDYISTIMKTYREMVPGPERDAFMSNPEVVGAFKAKGMPTTTHGLTVPQPQPSPLSFMQRLRGELGPRASYPVYGERAIPPDTEMSDIKRNSGIYGANILSKPGKTGADIPVMSRIELGEKPNVTQEARGTRAGYTHSYGPFSPYPQKEEGGGDGSEKLIDYGAKYNNSIKGYRDKYGLKEGDPIKYEFPTREKANQQKEMLMNVFKPHMGNVVTFTVEGPFKKPGVFGGEYYSVVEHRDEEKFNPIAALNIRQYTEPGQSRAIPIWRRRLYEYFMNQPGK
jgi:hypothetical protein